MLLQKIPLNPIIVGTIISWLTAQVLKCIIVFIEYKRWDLSRIIGSGGMPSSHSAGIVTAATLLYRYEGGMSAIFGFAVIVGLIVMYDASGVRRAAGKHAEILNALMDKWNDPEIFQKRLQELIGHTPLEVIAGASLGLIMGAIL